MAVFLVRFHGTGAARGVLFAGRFRSHRFDFNDACRTDGNVN